MIANLTDSDPSQPKLYPSKEDYIFIEKYKKDKYVCLAPTSVWHTKQLPKEKWVDIIHKIEENAAVYLLGGDADIIEL